MADLPDPVRSKRQQFLDNIPLGNFLLGPEAIRSYGTGLGMTLGGAAGGPLGAAGGGYAGSVLTQSLQGALPEIFGEPPIAGQLATATEDVLGNVAGQGIAKGVPWLYKTGKGILGPATESGRARLLQKLAETLGPYIQKGKWISPLAESDNPLTRLNVTSLTDQLSKKGVQLTVPQIVPHNFLLEMQALAKDTPEVLGKQQEGILRMAEDAVKPTEFGHNAQIGAYVKDIFGRQRPVNATKVYGSIVHGKKPGVNQSMDEWVQQVVDETGLDLGNKPVRSLLSQTTEITPFKQLVKAIGPDRARITLTKDAFEHAFDRQTGQFNSKALYEYFTKHRAQFNHAAEEMEKKFGTKASDLKSAWNQLIFGAEKAGIGRAGASRALEFQMSSATAGLMAAIPTIGFMNYPAMRSLGLLGKVGIIGPRIGKALNDPELVRTFAALRSVPANSTASLPKVQKLFELLAKKGIPISTSAGADYFILSGNQIVPAGTTKENLEREMKEFKKEEEVENPWAN